MPRYKVTFNGMTPDEVIEADVYQDDGDWIDFVNHEAGEGGFVSTEQVSRIRASLIKRIDRVNE